MRLHPSLAGALVIAAACGGPGAVTDAGVIRDWARALRAGDVDRAASYFSLPAIVENGTPPLRITSRAQVREFNRLLPCGARLLSTTRHGAYTYATFRLTGRVGGDCGLGVGGIAATAFLIRDGKIVEWRRLANPAQPLPRTPPPAPGNAPIV
jgi:ketosteroid isomerase-like protein